MLSKVKKLDAKLIRGKRIRLLFAAYIGILEILCGLLFGVLSVVEHNGKYMFTFLFFLIIGSCMIVFDYRRSELLCILGDDRLYFFHGQVEQRTPSSGRKVREWCDGSISYADIKKTEYVLRETRFIFLSYKQTLIITGSDFRLTILHGDKALLRKINKKRAAFSNTQRQTAALPDFNTMRHERSGVFEALWSILESGEHSRRFADGIRVLGLRLDEEKNFAELTVACGEKEYFIYLDADGAALGTDATGVLDTLAYSEAASMDDFFARWNTFVLTHS